MVTLKRITIGQKYGSLKVTGESNRRAKNGTRYLVCKCECGNEIEVRADNLRNGHTVSCGCARTVGTGQKGVNTTHGESNTRLYEIWCSMKKRCDNPNSNRYKNYGGKGIKYCDEWAEYTSFRDWALANGYADNLTIDRKDNDKGYCPSNCTWTTYTYQANNRTNNRKIEYNGETHTLAEWGRITGIKSSVIQSRIDRYNWSIEEALTRK